MSNTKADQQGLALRSDRIHVIYPDGTEQIFPSVNAAGRDPRNISGTELVRVLRGQHVNRDKNIYRYADGEKRQSNRRKTVVVTHKGREVFRGVAAAVTRFIEQETGRPLAMATLGRWVARTVPQPCEMTPPRKATAHLTQYSFDLEEGQ